MIQRATYPYDPPPRRLSDFMTWKFDQLAMR